ncbi:MAG: acyloxyacyl hydrolase [Salegentibacter sp.]|uniref:Lipid A 3-O-deacylase (PagL) n=1 Tax=Salegentibacter flavus TaxID=287099 RepID=A0A1I5BVB0_9FLAO|nr:MULTISPECIES: acyloxyacyl hydrolase [Salegentibacter]MDR9457845.1 acyloxyacyl hydrolase [Salegentibacter sp.]SFN78604.1 Lipid A 3-O-deacylase (PagL) [Salegentibacter flavus]
MKTKRTIPDTNLWISFMISKNFIEIGYLNAGRWNRSLARQVSARLWLWVVISFACATLQAVAQTDTVAVTENTAKQKPLFSIGLGAQHGFIFAHSEEVQNTRGARPTGIETILSWQRNDSATYALCRCYPRQGVMLAYYDYDVDLLGKSGTAAYFLEPTYRINNRVLFSFKGAAGLSYLTNPYDSIANPGNQSYSTHVSTYLLVGVGAWVRLSDRWWLNPSVNYQHISNGGSREPNKGINWPTAGIAVSYQPSSRPWYTGTPSTEKYWRNYSTRYDVALLGTMRNGYDEAGDRKKYLLGGLAVQAGRQVSSLSMLTVGAEAYQDEELKDKLRREGLNSSPVKAGLMLGHEFLLGRFQFSQRLGIYVFDQTPYYDRIFHRWGLQYRINRHFSAGFNLLAHRHIAEFIDFRLAYTFQKRDK